MKPAIIISLTLITIASSMHLHRTKSAKHQLSAIPESEGDTRQYAQQNQNWLQEFVPEKEPYQEVKSPFETNSGVDGWHSGLKQGPAVSLSETDKQQGYAGWMRQNELVQKPKIQHLSSKFYPEGKHFQNTGFGFMRDYDAEKSSDHQGRQKATSSGAEDEDYYKTYNSYGELVDLPPPISYSEGRPRTLPWGEASL
ncbi:hypothetical protein MP228_002874 [Amoeboaphelidium protococcarum]|nr:hypothetical protein MP228_002874 [Amoeboaphelidium protococcarum]